MLAWPSRRPSGRGEPGSTRANPRDAPEAPQRSAASQPPGRACATTRPHSPGRPRSRPGPPGRTCATTRPHRIAHMSRIWACTRPDLRFQLSTSTRSGGWVGV